jgi:hypothetical protein
VHSFLGKACVIDDPPAASTEVHMRHHPLRHAIEQLLVAPLGLGNKVMQGLVPGAGSQRIDAGGHGLDALARQGQHQAGAIPSQPCLTVGMAKPFGQMNHVAIKFFGYVHRTPFTGTGGHIMHYFL